MAKPVSIIDTGFVLIFFIFMDLMWDPGYAFQDQGWKQRNFLLCDLQEVVRQSDQSMIDALQRIRFGDYTAIEYFSKNARKKPFSSEEGVVYLCVKNRTAERVNDVRVSKLSGQCDLRRDELRS